MLISNLYGFFETCKIVTFASPETENRFPDTSGAVAKLTEIFCSQVFSALGDFAVSGVDLARFGSRFGFPNRLRHTVWVARTTKCLTFRQNVGSEDKMVARRLIWEI